MVYVSVNRHYSIKIILTIKIQSFAHPVRVNPIPRQIPPSPKYLRPWVRISIPYGKASTFALSNNQTGSGYLEWHPTVWYVFSPTS